MQQQQNQVFCCQQNHAQFPIQFVCVNKLCSKFHLYCFRCLQEGKHSGHEQQISFVGEFLRNTEENCMAIVTKYRNEMDILLNKFNKHLKGICQKYVIQETQFNQLNLYQKNAALSEMARFDKEALFQQLEFQMKELTNQIDILENDLQLNKLIYFVPDDESIEKSKTLYNQSYQLYNQRKFEEALNLLDLSLNHHPNHKDSLWLKGECLKMKGFYNEALIFNEKAFNQDPKCFKVISGKAECLRLQERYNDALSLYDLALQSQPLDISVICGKGECLKFSNDYNGAIECFEAVLSLKPKHVPSLFGKGDCLLCQGKFDLAIILFQKALSLDPSHELSKLGIQKCHEALGNQNI